MLRGALKDAIPWTSGDRGRLRAAYAEGGIVGAVQALPGRSRASLYHAAIRLGVTRRRRWTHAEEKKLAFLWGVESVSRICKILGRPRGGVMFHAVHVLGLSSGCPQGLEYLTEAATRTGYTAGQLRRILRWGRVEIVDAYTFLVRGKQRHLVDPFAVDDAIERWHATETLEHAARRSGVCAETLRARLLRVGVVIEKSDPRRKKSHYRVRSEDADRALGAASSRP